MEKTKILQDQGYTVMYNNADILVSSLKLKNINSSLRELAEEGLLAVPVFSFVREQ